MKYVDGTEAKRGDVIRWYCYDSDDIVTWEFRGMYTANGVVYLGGGIDFGMGIGQIIPVEEVIKQSENNDRDIRGIWLISSAHALAQHIANIAEY